MRFYLSSYLIGKDPSKLKSLISGDSNLVAYISNGFDGIRDKDVRKKKEQEDISQLENIGFTVALVNLRDYFGKTKMLLQKLSTCKLLWISGGNVFVLRQAMHLSGFDSIIDELLNEGVVYGGYSAGACVLSPSLKGYHIVDNPEENPYGTVGVIWDGLNKIEYNIAPHFNSNHPESAGVSKEIEYCINNNIAYKPLKDGEVIII